MQVCFENDSGYQVQLVFVPIFTEVVPHSIMKLLNFMTEQGSFAWCKIKKQKRMLGRTSKCLIACCIVDKAYVVRKLLFVGGILLISPKKAVNRVCTVNLF